MHTSVENAKAIGEERQQCVQHVGVAKHEGEELIVEAISVTSIFKNGVSARARQAQSVAPKEHSVPDTLMDGCGSLSGQ